MKDVVQPSSFFTSLGFRPAVETEVRDTDATFRFRSLSFEVEYPHGCGAAMSEFCRELERGSDPDRISKSLPFGKDDARALIDTLDRYGFLTERSPARPATAISGMELWRSVRALSERARATLPMPFTEKLLVGTASARQLVAYVEQYYNVVRHGAAIAAAAFANARSDDASAILENFARGEFGHDRLLERSLRAVDVDPQEVASRGPWRTTFAIISHLRVLADQDPLAFAACLFLVEEANEDFHQAFERCARAQGLPAAFIDPVLKHAAINDGEAHGNISAQLLGLIDAISFEESASVQCHVVSLLDSLSAFDQALAAVA